MNREFFSGKETGLMNYAVFYPHDREEDIPLLIYLHGAGERGETYEHLYRHGIPKLIGEGREYPAVVLCPQCPADAVWDNVVKDLKQIIDTVVLKFGIAHDRICLTGSSMGGFGTWMTALTYPNLFAAVAPVAGGGMSWRAANLRTTPIRAYHGVKDTAVPMIYSQLMVEAVNNKGGEAQLILLEDFGHNDAIDEVYRNTDVIPWLLSRRREDNTPVAEALSEWF